MIVSRGSRIAYYSTPATVTAERVTARFGSLGEIDYRFAPKPGASVDCTGAEEGEASFDGTFEFTGENGYVQIDAAHAQGSFQIYPEPKNCPRGRLGRRVVPYHPSYSSEGTTLKAMSGSRAEGRIREILVSDDGRHGSRGVAIFAVLAEKRKAMTVSHGVQLRVGSGAFRWDLHNGTATLRPPAPFTGSATLHPPRRRRPRDLERVTRHADFRRQAGETRRRPLPRLHPQGRAAGRVRPADGSSTLDIPSQSRRSSVRLPKWWRAKPPAPMAHVQGVSANR